MYSADLNICPEPLQDFVVQQWQNLLNSLENCTLSKQQVTALTKVIIASNYVLEQFAQKPALLKELIDSGELLTLYQTGAYAEKLAALLQNIDDDLVLEQQLRLFRAREMVRIIWRDVNRLSDTRQTIGELSALADACVDETLKKLYTGLCARWGVPYADGEDVPQQMVVLGMGKLGAAELNLSSDIDLMFCYPQNGSTRGQKKSIDNQDFFIRLGKKLIRALDAPTADGFVFRVDMRLRPFGTVSPLACSFTAMENYYQQHGREWERYAMIKARVISGDWEKAQQLMADLRPFVYRKYIDYSAFESLREMKAMINTEVRRKGLHNNVKLGSGGIREIEFIVQAFQLIRGGRDKRLQQRSLLDILPLLPEAVGIPVEVVEELRSAYLFLRDTEHAIQAINDRQTQELPVDERELLRVAAGLGFADTASFLQQLTLHRNSVSLHFADLLAPVEEQPELQHDDADWLLLWELTLSTDEGVLLCTEKGFDQPELAASLMVEMAGSKAVKMLQPITLQRLKQVVPKLLGQICLLENSYQTLVRVLKMLRAILRRSAYLVLLVENPDALQQLVKLCSASSWFAETLTRQPVLLDELISPQTLYTPPDKAQLEADLNQQMLRIPEEDEEQLMESLRYFKHAHVLRVAASDITGVLPLMKVSDYLTWLAESILQRVLDIAWRKLVAKHGQPCDADGEEQGREFIVVAYGKMGGIELSYGSDLDLVFLHACDSNAYTKGAKPIANSVFFTRLGQRVIHMLNTYTASGQLYEIDMRLRPAGNSGLLVSTLAAFSQYQNHQAWTWEHQALVRARVVCGSDSLSRAFGEVRNKVLMRTRERTKLQQEVGEMRDKMRGHLGSNPSLQQQQFDLKQDRGGIVDIEFLVQYFCLAYAEQYPEIIQFTDNIRILQSFGKVGILSGNQCEKLIEAYIVYRSIGHRQAMQEQSATIIEADKLQRTRADVQEIWDEYLTLG
ncbi:MAG: bifunctional [glutamate--ammonia ligase]-adenylyl-L-tyrosine phosphorylase/[glutamate--ammonia-ligase] adenylyltransferase [Oceanospirillaceae bacterium]|nr:bifunctional [glutamate--ammonia ligase]-adenylyl-L-tyrosine phosphorylase/[glutamate--ammonia-ligase] adenylyltransferase [Oceanospirillaceae bacterium]